MRPILRRIRHLAGKHAITAAVAAGIVALAMAEGGYGPVAFAAGALVVWAAVLLGLATGILPRSEPPRPAIAAGACLLGLAALTALSLAWANDDGRAFEDVVRALGYLGLFALAVVAARRGDGAQWLRGLAIGLTAVAAIALGSRLEPSIFGDADLEIAASLPVAQGRLSYPIGYWNGLASMMAIAVVLLGWLGVAAASRARRSIAVARDPAPGAGDLREHLARRVDRGGDRPRGTADRRPGAPADRGGAGDRRRRLRGPDRVRGDARRTARPPRHRARGEPGRRAPALRDRRGAAGRPCALAGRSAAGADRGAAGAREGVGRRRRGPGRRRDRGRRPGRALRGLQGHADRGRGLGLQRAEPARPRWLERPLSVLVGCGGRVRERAAARRRRRRL